MRRFIFVYVFFLGAVVSSSGSPDTQTDWLLSHSVARFYTYDDGQRSVPVSGAASGFRVFAKAG